MAKVTAPLLSFSARGTIAKTQTYASWRGVPYARQRVVPSNPNSSAQQETRNSFKWLQGVWKLLSADAVAPWNAFAKGKPLTGRNAFGSFNIAALRTATDLTDLVLSPGVGGAPPVAGVAAVGGAGTATLTVTAPELPSGWTITEAVGVLIMDQDPQTDSDFTSYSATDDTAPWELDFTGLPAGDYEYGVWMVFTKPTGEIAYSPGTGGTVTAT